MKKKMLIIVILVSVLSFFVIRASYALYRNVVNPNGNIATATWNVTLNQDDEEKNLSIVAGDENSTASYNVNVTSTSEVDIIYSIVVDNIPDGVEVKLDDGEYQTPSDNQIVFSDVSTINYTSENKTKTHVLTFKAESNTEEVLDEEIDITVVARQTLTN